jgi:hypothetical protein
MKNPALFFGAIVLILIGIAGGIYFILPLQTHLLVSHPGSAYKHASILFGLAVIGIVAAFVSRPKAKTA